MVANSVSHILSIDSAMGGASAGVYSCADGRMVSRVMEQAQGQSEFLVPMVQEVMEEAGLAFSDLGLIVTSVGPGAFTGLRTGLSCARSFALALDVPLVGLSTFEILAQDYVSNAGNSEAQVCVLIESRRQEFFAQIFDGEAQPVSGPMVALKDDVLSDLSGSCVLIGDALERFGEAEGCSAVDGYSLPKPEVMARLGLARYQACDGAVPVVEPLYLRDADVSVSKKKQRVLKI